MLRFFKAKNRYFKNIVDPYLVAHSEKISQTSFGAFIDFCSYRVCKRHYCLKSDEFIFIEILFQPSN